MISRINPMQLSALERRGFRRLPPDNRAVARNSDATPCNSLLWVGLASGCACTKAPPVWSERETARLADAAGAACRAGTGTGAEGEVRIVRHEPMQLSARAPGALPRLKCPITVQGQTPGDYNPAAAFGTIRTSMHTLNDSDRAAYPVPRNREQD